MDTGFAFGEATGSGGAVSGPVQVANVVSGSVVSWANGQQNGSILIKAAGPIASCTLNLPSPARDGQIITVRSTQSIAVFNFVPAIPTADSGMAAGDQFQIKWYQDTADWSVIK